MTLRTDRLLLRRFTAADGPGLHAYLSQEQAVRFEPYGVHDLAQATRVAADRAGDDAFWAVCLADGGELVGNLYLAPEGPAEWRTWELGYVFHPGRWGHGYATEACRALLDHVMTAHAAHRVVARCDPENVRSWALLERLGLRREGHLRAAASFTTGPDGRPVWHDAYLYAVLADEWRAARDLT